MISHNQHIQELYVRNFNSVSIISTVIMTYLFISEFFEFLETKSSSEMLIDVERGGDKVRLINLVNNKFRYNTS